jgi:hypothetical protein
MASTTNYDEIMLDRKLFNEFVYTPLSLALKILDERQKDPVLMAKVERLLNGDIPEVLKGKKCGVQFRQIVTPNNDAKHFLEISKNFGLIPVFMEYHNDKFSSNNNFKCSLGKIQIQGPVNKQDKYRIEKMTIMDFNVHNGKSLKDAVTSWGESLIHFHRRLFNSSNINDSNCYFYDMSDWVKNHGKDPKDYYEQFLLLFSCFGILFENFPINGKDSGFSNNIILPAIEKIISSTGVKPLIVPIPPMDMEDDDYWTLYNDEELKNIINNSTKQWKQ